MSTRCKFVLPSGDQCKLMTNNPNGYCHLASHQAAAPAPKPTAPVAPVAPVTPAPATATVAPATTPAQQPQPQQPAPARSNNLPWIIGGIIVALILVLLACSGLTVFAANRGLFPVAPPVVVNTPTPIVITATPTTPPTPTLPPTQPPAAPQTAVNYPLAGQRYESPQGDSYSAVWTNDGRLWQPRLPTGAERIAHTVAITIEEGQYAFDGVECQLFVDATRNGAGASNPVTVEYGNDLRFSVSTADHGQAWALVQCRGNASSGFQIRWLGH